MTINKYKAKGIDTSHYYYGSYFQMPYKNNGGLTTLTDKEWDEREKKNIRHYIIYCTQGDWGLPNEAKMVEIDPSTLTHTDDTWEV